MNMTTFCLIALLTVGTAAAEPYKLSDEYNLGYDISDPLDESNAAEWLKWSEKNNLFQPAIAEASSYVEIISAVAVSPGCTGVLSNNGKKLTVFRLKYTNPPLATTIGISLVTATPTTWEKALPAIKQYCQAPKGAAIGYSK